MRRRRLRSATMKSLTSYALIGVAMLALPGLVLDMWGLSVVGQGVPWFIQRAVEFSPPLAVLAWSGLCFLQVQRHRSIVIALAGPWISAAAGLLVDVLVARVTRRERWDIGLGSARDLYNVVVIACGGGSALFVSLVGAMMADRSDSGTACPNCGYPRAGLRGAVCPECGAALDRQDGPAAT